MMPAAANAAFGARSTDSSDKQTIHAPRKTPEVTPEGRLFQPNARTTNVGSKGRRRFQIHNLEQKIENTKERNRTPNQKKKKSYHRKKEKKITKKNRKKKQQSKQKRKQRQAEEKAAADEPQNNIKTTKRQQKTKKYRHTQATQPTKKRQHETP